MNSRDYWKKRALYEKQKQIEGAADYESAMRSRLKDLEKEVKKETYSFITRYAENNEISIEKAAKILASITSNQFDMTLEEFERKAKAGGYEKELNSAYYKSRIQRLKKLYEQLQELSSRYALSEERRLRNKLITTYNDTYLHDAYYLGSAEIDFAHFNEQELKDSVYQPWEGSDFSSRIWNTLTDTLPEALCDALLRGVLLGYSHQRVEKMLSESLRHVEDKNLHRLVVTEIGHVQERATAKFYEDAEIEKYQYLATLETKTCKICRKLDGKVFSLKQRQEAVNYPLMHPYCRCTTIPYDDNLPRLESRWYRDPKTGKGKWVSYSDWKKKNGFEPLKFNRLSYDFESVYTEKARNKLNKQFEGNNINSYDYRSKFNSISDNPKLNYQIYRAAKSLLTHRQGTDLETSYVLDSEGNIIVSSTGNTPLEVGISDKDTEKIKNYPDYSLIGIHNHPTNIAPDGSDFAVAAKRKYKFGVVVCHNGDVFVYSAGQHVSQKFIDREIAKARDNLYNDTEEKVISEVMARLEGCGLSCQYLKQEKKK